MSIVCRGFVPSDQTGTRIMAESTIDLLFLEEELLKLIWGGLIMYLVAALRFSQGGKGFTTQSR